MMEHTELYTHLMVSDIELKYCIGCGIYRSLDKFYNGVNQGNYCCECRMEKCARYNKTYAERRRKEKESRARESRQRIAQIKEAMAKVKATKPKPKPCAVRTTEATPMGARTTESNPPGEQCRNCKSFSKHDARSGWCMSVKKQVRGNHWCSRYRTDVKVRYEMEAKAVAVLRSTPWD
ncbi:MAG: hypothetical protein IKH15_06670 [Bacteroidales bacterium]|nr:hypothetical protein [Bacteroidales bacterium]MBR7051612.1 hypothetical protein [Bacteroidaceae bacterium]